MPLDGWLAAAREGHLKEVFVGELRPNMWLVHEHVGLAQVQELLPAPGAHEPTLTLLVPALGSDVAYVRAGRVFLPTFHREE